MSDWDETQDRTDTTADANADSKAWAEQGSPDHARDEATATTDAAISGQNVSVQDMLERYATLRDTIQSLKAEQDELSTALKEALAAGERAETPLYRAELRRSVRVEYPIDCFREVFGDTATLEVASVDRRRAEALASAGDLDGKQLKNLGVSKEILSLRLIPKTL